MLEALSFGLPVIASDIPANQEIGLDESSYFAVGDVQDLSRALVRIMQVPQSEAAIVERRTFVAARYNWDRIAEQTLRVYEEVLSSSQS
jgi:glycosyltransferase involved in cell wall biosynthesis